MVWAYTQGKREGGKKVPPSPNEINPDQNQSSFPILISHDTHRLFKRGILFLFLDRYVGNQLVLLFPLLSFTPPPPSTEQPQPSFLSPPPSLVWKGCGMGWKEGRAIGRHVSNHDCFPLLLPFNLLLPSARARPYQGLGQKVHRHLQAFLSGFLGSDRRTVKGNCFKMLLICFCV